MQDQPPGAKGPASSDNGVSDRQQPYQTHSAPIFVQNAEELIRLLANEPSLSVRGMQREAEELAERFRRWQSERPTNAARVTMIQELFELNRRARDHLANLQKRPVAPPEAPSTPNINGFLRRLFKR